MVGNDVVDLGDEETIEGNLHSRFDERVFSARELAMLKTSGDRHRMRWTLWAAKESAYKLARRDDPEVVFAHRAFEVSLGDGGWGEVRHRERFWCVRVHQLEDAVHVVCSHDRTGHARTRAGLALRAADQSASEAVRDFVRRELSVDLSAAPHRIVIEARDDRIPMVRVHGHLRDGSLSLSHHGRFVAFAYRPL